MKKGLIWATADNLARNRGKVISLYRQILGSLNSSKLEPNLSARTLGLRSCSAMLDSVLISEPNNKNRPLAQKLQSFVKMDALVGATSLMVGKFFNSPAKADSSPAMMEYELAFLGVKTIELGTV
ncbi:hypothetical protein V6N13_066664 [Hibiscus sabdariffa]|uniref:LYR motif containing domain-containing protein n=1 Tax=Hibiscus sabdariffa TaxID=183260 RepID=A0ABR2DR44_9ROSI